MFSYVLHLEIAWNIQTFVAYNGFLLPVVILTFLPFVFFVLFFQVLIVDLCADKFVVQVSVQVLVS